MIANPGAIKPWLPATALGLVLLQGCATLLTSRPNSRVVVAESMESEQISALQEAPVPQISLRVDQLRAHVQLQAMRRCVAQKVHTRPRVEETWTTYVSWGWFLAAAEAGAGAAAWQAGKEAVDGSLANWAWAGAALALIGATAVDVWHLGGQNPQRRQLPLASQEEFGSWRLVTCGSEAVNGGELTLHGGRADWRAAVDASGSATIAVDELPMRSFPYQRPLAEIACGGCSPVPLVIDPAFAAQLVIARMDLEDLETWLLLHGGHPDAPRVAAERAKLVQAQQSVRLQARRAAESALEQGDLASAAQAVRRCQDAAKTPAPACDELGRRVEDRFVAIQLDQGRRALARGAPAEAEAAHYRCTLIDRQRPACQELERLLASARKQALTAAQELASQRLRARDAGLWLAVRHRCRRGPIGACKAAVARCLAVNQEHELCLQKRAAIAKGRQRQ